MARLTSKGQVTIPKRVRDYLGLKPGSIVEFQVKGDGEVTLKTNEPRPPGPGDRIAGTLGPGMSTDELMRLTRGWGEDDDVK
jgi:antitoxin PrlF